MTKVLAIAVVAFGLAYACLWWSLQRFYAPFGVSPQDVGLSPSGNASDLPGAALQLGIWMLIGLAIMAVLPTIAVLLLELALAKDSEASPKVAVPVALALAAVTALFYWWIVDEWTGLVTISVAAAIFGLVQYGLTRTAKTLKLVAADSTSARQSTEENADPAAKEPAKGLRGRLLQIGASEDLAPRLSLAFSIFLASAVVGIAFLDLPTDAAEAGSCVRDKGESVPSLNLPLPGLHLPILSVHAQPATLTWLTATPPQEIDRLHVVYLGATGGSIIVYDRTNHRTSRIPTGTAIVNIDPNVEHCPGVH
jgi:hypothetical protein